MNKTTISPKQAGQDSERGVNQTLASQGNQGAICGADPTGANDTDAALHTVAAGIKMGSSPLQFMDSIDAGGRQLGNRAFLHWAGQLYAEGLDGKTHEIATQGLQDPGRPLTHLDALQQAFGRHDIRGMREHTGPVAGLALEALEAEAYTCGGRMAIAGSPNLYTQAHEAAHGVQQAALGDRMPLPDGIGVAGDQYEQQADAVAQAVLSGESAQPLLDQVAAEPTQVKAASVCDSAPVQMKGKKDKNNKDDKPEDEYEHGMPALETASLEMINLIGNSDLSAPSESSIELQHMGVIIEDEAPGLPDEILGSDSDSDSDSDSEFENDPGGFMASYFPAVLALHNAYTNRVDHIQTADHGALSLPGLGNLLATIMLGSSIIGVGLPLDLLTNLLGGISRCIMLLCDIFFGKPSTWLLNCYFRSHPPSAEDRARVTSDELPKGPPRGIDWNVSLPEMIGATGISAYLQASVTQGSLSPGLWLQPWNPARIATIIVRVIMDIFIYLGQFTFSPQISRRVLQDRLGWSETRSGLFISMLYTHFGNVITYIASFLTNAEVAIYLVFQNAIEDDNLTPTQAAAAVVGYTALGMLIQLISASLFVHFVNKRVNEKNLIPWLRQFRAIPNRLLRTMVIALGSLRNVIINILSLTLTLGQISANIIGPLSTGFGQGGACFWPLAVANVCGGPPAGFNLTEYLERIEAGEENLTFGQLFAIQIFPWLAGLIGVGAPVVYVLHQYHRARRNRSAAHMPVLEEIRSELRDSDPIVGEDDVSNVASPAPEEIQSVTGSEDSQLAVSVFSGASPTPANLTAQMLFELLIRQDSLTPTDLRRTLDQHVGNGDITAEEAELIEAMVREEVVLAKER